jgi:Insertion element 4 transposase N-terminal
MGQSVITREIQVAPGRFAPGHLDELTQQVPFEMVDAVLAQTGAVQSRIRDLPARVVVYLLLAGCLFAELGYGQVWHRLVAGGVPLKPGSREVRCAAVTSTRSVAGRMWSPAWDWLDCTSTTCDIRETRAPPTWASRCAT